jgi:hypothetical protein
VGNRLARWERFRGEAQGNTELEDFVTKMEGLVKDGEHKDWIHRRQKGIDILVTDFKVRAFEELKGRVSHISKPTKQLLIRLSDSKSERRYWLAR